MRKTMSVVVLLLIAMPALAANWRYVVYLGETLIYDGPILPLDVNLAYPAEGQTAPLVKVGAEPRGRLLTPAEYADQLTRPHIIIIPPPQTAGGGARPAASSLGVPVQFGSY
jgi:hypothetical protein